MKTHRLDTSVPVRLPEPPPGYNEPEPHAAQREREGYHPNTWRMTPEERTEIEPIPDYPTPDDKEPVLGEIPGESNVPPLPVTIVDSPEPRENWLWGTSRFTVVAGRPVQIAGRDNRRRRLQIHNNDDTDNVFLLSDPVQVTEMGYQLEPGRTLELFHNDNIWAKTVADVIVSVASEYSPHEAE